MSGVDMMMEASPAVHARHETREPLMRRPIDRDAALVARLRGGDPDAVDMLIETYSGRAYRLAVRITGNASDAEEVVQDALWAVASKIHLFRGESAFGSWVYRIVANAAYQKVRRVRRRPEISLDDVLPPFSEDGTHAAPVDDWSARVCDPARQSDVRRALTAALDLLSASARAALVLHELEGFSIAEVAETMGTTICGTKSRIHRARLFLRKHLGESLSAA